MTSFAPLAHFYFLSLLSAFIRVQSLFSGMETRRIRNTRLAYAQEKSPFERGFFELGCVSIGMATRRRAYMGCCSARRLAFSLACLAFFAAICLKAFAIFFWARPPSNCIFLLLIIVFSALSRLSFRRKSSSGLTTRTPGCRSLARGTDTLTEMFGCKRLAAHQTRPLFLFILAV